MNVKDFSMTNIIGDKITGILSLLLAFNSKIQIPFKQKTYA